MTRRSSIPPPKPPWPASSSIPPALRHAVRDGIIDPATSLALAPYLPNFRHTPRGGSGGGGLDVTARIVGKVVALLLFIAVTSVVLGRRPWLRA